jgi:hypothetical protein
MGKDEALKLALDALEPQEMWAEWYLEGHVIPKAVEAINQALMQSSKQWVGLTADEMENLYQTATYMDETDYIHMLMIAEERLKEKNHG